MTDKPVIAAVGAGRMGRGLAHVFAYAGHEIRLLDAKERDAAAFENLKADALSETRRTIGLMASLGRIDGSAIDGIMARVSVLPLDRAADALGDADLILEGVPEVLDAKQRAFALTCEHATGDAIIASTTSMAICVLTCVIPPCRSTPPNSRSRCRFSKESSFLEMDFLLVCVGRPCHEDLGWWLTTCGKKKKLLAIFFGGGGGRGIPPDDDDSDDDENDDHDIDDAKKQQI